ncbi:hypothetical protein M0804_003026 [Polistes exclamans]|nr:hypothetical protein M0804_003026 [Polistes exclamans]
MSCAILNRLVLIPCRQSINCGIYRKVENVFTFTQKKITVPLSYSVNMNVFISCRSFHKIQFLQNIATNKTGIQENISTLQLKKRSIRKNKQVVGEEASLTPGVWIIKALATAEEYNLENLEAGLLSQQLYIPQKICTSTNLCIKIFVNQHEFFGQLNATNIELSEKSAYPTFGQPNPYRFKISDVIFLLIGQAVNSRD